MTRTRVSSFFSFTLFAFVITTFPPFAGVTAHAAPPNPNLVLTCSGREGATTVEVTRVKALVYQVLETSSFTDREGKPHVNQEAQVLSLLGPVRMNYQGTFRDQDPEAALVDLQAPGKSTALIALKRSATSGLHVFEFDLNRSSFDANCAEGSGFAAFARQVGGMREIAKETYGDYADDQTAFRCVSLNPADRGIRYGVRALSNDYANSEVQVEISNSGIEFPSTMDRFTESATTIAYTQASTTFEYPPAPKNEMFVLTKKPSVARNGKVTYAAEYFSGRAAGSVKLACEPRWTVQSHIFKPIAESHSIAKSLPAPGTKAQIDPSLCANSERLNTLRGQYQDLIMKIPGINGFGLSALTPEKSPFGIRCYDLTVSAENEGNLAKVRAALGDSFFGYSVIYEIEGPAVAL